MPGKTSISWATDTWNLWWGCRKVSPGCANCYIETTPPFRMRGMEFVKGEMPLVFHWDRLDVPFKWKRPRVIFVNSLNDTFDERVTDEDVTRVFAAMAQAPWHTFMVLTKREERMRTLLSDELFQVEVGWPLPNVWMGVTIENRAFTDRADALRATPAAKRFISAEPLLGPLVPRFDPDGDLGECVWPDEKTDMERGTGLYLADIDLVIIGGESGPKARRFDEQWARDIIALARRQGTAVEMKQMGTVWARQRRVYGKADNPAEWPEDLRIQESPASVGVEQPSGPPIHPTLF